jgi:hypothetical protein
MERFGHLGEIPQEKSAGNSHGARGAGALALRSQSLSWATTALVTQQQLGKTLASIG